MRFEAENRYKSEIAHELFTRADVTLPKVGDTIHSDDEWHYRNKMEYSFWGDEQGLHLSLHKRGSHGKEIVEGSELAKESLDKGAMIAAFRAAETRY